MFHPSLHPEKTLIVITAIVYIGIVAGYLVDEYFMIFAHVLWMLFTAFLSFKQFSLAKRRKHSNFVELLLFKPEIRFFLFEIIASIGLTSIILFKAKLIGTIVLTLWWGFAIHFYSHYIKEEVNKKFKV